MHPVWKTISFKIIHSEQIRFIESKVLVQSVDNLLGNIWSTQVSNQNYFQTSSLKSKLFPEVFKNEP